MLNCVAIHRKYPIGGGSFVLYLFDLVIILNRLLRRASVENLQNIGIRRRSLSNSRRGSIEHLSVCNQNVQMHRRIWHRDQYGRVKTASRVVNEEERQYRLENQDKNMEKLEWECEQRKKILKDFDRKRQNSAKNLILVESANERNRIGNIVSPKHKPNSANSRQDSQ